MECDFAGKDQNGRGQPDSLGEQQIDEHKGDHENGEEDKSAYYPMLRPTCHRLRLLEGRAALQVDDLDRVAQLFDGNLVVPDLREGELSLSQVWFDYHARRVSRAEGLPVDDALRARIRELYPVPSTLDFRMSAES